MKSQLLLNDVNKTTPIPPSRHPLPNTLAFTAYSSEVHHKRIAEEGARGVAQRAIDWVYQLEAFSG